MLRLEFGNASMVVTPEYGAALLGWTFDGEHVMRHALPDAVMSGDVRGMACFPLVPFCNRIATGRFEWQGVSYQLERNFGDHPHTIHGVGWQRRWTIASASENRVTLVLQHDATGAQARHWPFPFTATVTYMCLPQKMTIMISVLNRHTEAAPLGIGLHPYFPRTATAALQFKAGGVWMMGRDSLRSQHAKVPHEWDHATAREIGSARLDNCFTDWDRRAHITGIAGGITIEAASAFRHLQVYTPHEQNFFCVEPVSHVPDAINRPVLPSGQGMHMVAPDDMLSGTVSFTLGGAASPG